MRSSPLARVASRGLGCFSCGASRAWRGLAAVLSSALIACSSSSPPKENAALDSGAPSPPTGEAVPSGSNCTNLTESFSTCSNLSICPNILIDRYKFPECGYVVHGNVIDPECLCYGSLCPMGAPQTCADMAALLAVTTTDIVCKQYESGHCLNMGGIQTISQQCLVCNKKCSGDPTCLKNCGC